MVVAGKPRGNAIQLASYLLMKGENENISILEVDGRLNASEGYLKNLLYSMELNSELTRSNKSVYHAMLNPNPEEKEDRIMTAEDWQKSADILARNLSMEQQRRVIVLHEKKGRVHAHVVFERYDHEKDRMIDYKNNYKAHDKARFEIEKELGHKPTPQKNKDQPKHKQTLTDLWNKSKTGEEFIKRAKKCGYQVSKGYDRPFRIVDANGISFDLVRQLDGIKTKEVKDRFVGTELMDDKKAIELMSSHKKERQIIKPSQSKQAELVLEAEGKPQTNDNAKVELERQRREFIEDMRKAREQNERRNGLIRTFCISAFLMLRVAIDKYLITDRPTIDLYQENKTAIVTAIPERKGFVETAQFYKPI